MLPLLLRHKSPFSLPKFLSPKRFYKQKPRSRSRPQQQQPHQNQPSQNQHEIQIPITPSQTLLKYLGIYITVINVGSYSLFAYDKSQAKSGGWRIRERDLQLSALVGGWVGGMLAMQQFRHKTVKQAFLQPYLLATGANVVGVVAAVWAWRFRPTFRSSVVRSLRL